MKKLDGKVVLITGASKGIGLGCGLAVLRHGGRVAALALDAEECSSEYTRAGHSVGKDVLPINCDVRDATAMATAFSKTLDHFGKLDGLINNAGWHPPAMTIEETSLEDFESLVKLNLTSTFVCCKLAIPHLKKTQGAIVIMSSEVALLGQGAAPSYVATKAGQLGLMRALALDLAPENVRVNAVCPAGVMTPLMNEWAATQYDPSAALKQVDNWHPMGRMATIDEMGEVCAFLLSRESSFVTGQVICPDGGASLGYADKAPKKS